MAAGPKRRAFARIACVAIALGVASACGLTAQSTRAVPEPYFEALGKRIRGRLGDLGSARDHRFGAADSFTVESWVSGGAPASGEAILFANKRDGADGRGWAMFAHPFGMWQWQCSSGDRSAPYVPYRSQKITDNRLHQLVVTVDRAHREIRAYFDGRVVAVLDSTDVGDLTGRGNLRASALLERAALWRVALDAEQVAARYRAIVGDAKPAPEREPKPTDAPFDLRVATFNIRDGGRTLGEHKGVNYVIDVLRASKADVVCLQEANGSASRIADGLGLTVYLRGKGLAILSRYPIERSVVIGDAKGIVAVRVKRPDGATAIVGSVSTRDATAPGLSAVLKAIADVRTSDEPVVIAGDFKGPSHLDGARSSASERMKRAGYIDCFRSVHADAERVRGRTWSLADASAEGARVDFIYCTGEGVAPRAAGVLDQHEHGFPSDHAAVWASIRITR